MLTTPSTTPSLLASNGTNRPCATCTLGRICATTGSRCEICGCSSWRTSQRGSHQEWLERARSSNEGSPLSQADSSERWHLRIAFPEALFELCVVVVAIVLLVATCTLRNNRLGVGRTRCGSAGHRALLGTMVLRFYWKIGTAVTCFEGERERRGRAERDWEAANT